jgi:hypothetical protein
MGLFDKIIQPFANRRIKKEQLEELIATLWRIVADGQITDAEIGELNSFFVTSELTDEEIAKAKSDIFAQLIYSAIVDRRVTEAEYRSLEHIAQRLSLPADVISGMRAKIQYYRLFSALESGAALPVVNAPGIVMQKGEICHASIPAKMLEERVIKSGYAGRSHGISLPIVKGVRYRIGSSRGNFVSEKGIVPVSFGTLNITDQRIVFSGDGKSHSAPYSKLIDVQTYADAIQYSVMARQKPIIIGFDVPENAELAALIISRAINA